MPLLLSLLLALLIGCSSADETRSPRTVEQIFLDGKKAYDDNDWIEAQSQFDIIKLQYPASQYADDAQFYLAEICYRRGEFVLAAFNYSVVRRSFPASEFAKTSAYQVGVCYEEMSLPPDRDQEYTLKAISAYTEFQAVYPTDSLSMVALEHIHELRNKLAEKYMLAGEHYERTNSRRAAIVYYDAVTTEYPDSKYYEQALVNKLRIYYALAKIDEARGVISVYRRTVKEPAMKTDVDEMERNLP